MRYEVRLMDAYFYVGAPSKMEAEWEAAWAMEKMGLVGDITVITRDESENDDED